MNGVRGRWDEGREGVISRGRKSFLRLLRGCITKEEECTMIPNSWRYESRKWVRRGERGFKSV
jgi:hypothetical protein